MKKIILFLGITMFIIINCKGQENNCTDTELYTIVFEEMKINKRKAVEIEIGFQVEPSHIEIISKLNIFNKKELEQFNSQTENMDYMLCSKLKKQVQSILSDEIIKEDGSYIKHFFSQIIFLSDSKKCILNKTAIKNKNYEGGKIIGHEIIYIFSLIDDKWVLIDKKSIGMS
ncbi:hypothetical protein ATE84_1006 [Aquimarina sp. MAR_2010_214]|uniref:hypothetical protein n=1 Tax=Aquimarina sp. MAR_2010_214 TaxID=1250026 RepID=UPI000C7138BB|nr:hypothetical protein [Aquimarina sp. MAR_2010_214]PKV48990.1 hypothetical protein ATE84_1006 [Aquimarina sp. MAR_2010_214]